MAEFSKKIYLKNSAGTQQTAKIYSTTGESQTPYFPLVVDGVQGYVALVSTSDNRATSGRVKHSNGNTYAIGTMGTPPYNYQLITAVGGGTFIVPAGVSKMRVTCVGGGAGGVTVVGGVDKNASIVNRHLPNAYDSTRFAEVTRGGSTWFGSVSAAGATPAGWGFTYTDPPPYWEDGDRIDPDPYYTRVGFGVSQGTVNGSGALDTGSYFVGAPAVPLTLYNGAQVATAGAGGVADGEGDDVSSGGSGYKTVSTINVTPGSTISYNVGNFGYGMKLGSQMSSVSNSSGGRNAGRGYPGAILVEWGQGIQ